MNISRRKGTFDIHNGEGRQPWPFSMSFEWGGEMFVVHRSLVSDYWWKVSHRDTGYAVMAGKAGNTAQAAIRTAIEVLEKNGVRRLKNRIRKAKIALVERRTGVGR